MRGERRGRDIGSREPLAVGQRRLVFPRIPLERRGVYRCRRNQQITPSDNGLYKAVIITNPIHPWHDRKFNIKAVVRRGELLELWLTLDNGKMFRLPASETDFCGSPFQNTQKSCCFDASKLLKLVEKLSNTREKDVAPCLRTEDTQPTSLLELNAAQINERHQCKEHQPTSFSTGTDRQACGNDGETCPSGVDITSWERDQR